MVGTVVVLPVLHARAQGFVEIVDAPSFDTGSDEEVSGRYDTRDLRLFGELKETSVCGDAWGRFSCGASSCSSVRSAPAQELRRARVVWYCGVASTIALSTLLVCLATYYLFSGFLWSIIYALGLNTLEGVLCSCAADCAEQGLHCCRDATASCSTCARLRCVLYDWRHPCQCHADCERQGNCCSDFAGACAADKNGDFTPTYILYMYRAQSDKDYKPLNTNLASLGGALWYLHNEVVDRCDSGRGDGSFGFRRFNITRLMRYKVTFKTTAALYQQGMSFGMRVAYDYGKCTGGFRGISDCGATLHHYGYVIGCSILGHGPYPLCAPWGPEDEEQICPINYPGGTWYSMPGPCSDFQYFEHDDKCEAADPGGYRDGPPTGSPNCTWTYEDAGHVDLDELVGVTPMFDSHYDFCKAGCIEYDKYGASGAKDRGKCGISFWDYKHSEKDNIARIEATDAAFKKKYPSLPGDAGLPDKDACDFTPDIFYKGLEA